jgi:hypothetical protein
MRSPAPPLVAYLLIVLFLLSACAEQKEAEIDPRMQRVNSGGQAHGEVGITYAHGSGHGP